MSTVKQVRIVSNDGQELGVFDLALAQENLAMLSLVLPYLSPSTNTDGTIKNIQIASPKNINLEPDKGVKVKVGNKAQIELLPDKSGDLREFVVKAWRSVEVSSDGKTPELDSSGNYVDLDDEILVKAKLYCDNLELNNYDKVLKKTRGNNKILFKCDSDYTKGILQAASLDIRAMSAGAGTGGGIAIQIAGVDSDGHENKFKIETDRTIDVDDTNSPSAHNGEGGKGIEIGTINSQMTSLYTKTYRFKADAPIYAVTRGEIVETETGKYDYPTQDDDSKDIIDDDDPITWEDVIAAVKYLKTQGSI